VRRDQTPPPTAEDIFGNGEPRARRGAAKTLSQVERIFASFIRDDDPIPTRAVLAAYLANRRLDGDPTWLMLVGGSGVGKTERLTPLAGMPDVILESSISGPAALLSGTGRKERAKDASGGILRKVPEGGGVLVLKDFTSILDMHRDARAELLAAFREIHDGSWQRSVGAEGGRSLTWSGHLGLITGCTSAIDSAHTVMASMGTRFVYVRLAGDPHIATSALEHVGRERSLRATLQAAVCGLLSHPPGQPYPVAARRDSLAALANYAARARSPVDRDHQGELRLVLDPEAPSRIAKVLAQIWRACGLLALSPADAWAVTLRVGQDSIPKLRRVILDHLAQSLTLVSTTAVAEHCDHPTRTTRRTLEDLAAHRVIQRIAGGEGKADLWTLTAQTREWLALATLPEMSEHPSRSPNTVIDDISGKVPPNEHAGDRDAKC
jgi:hypothetical protein